MRTRQSTCLRLLLYWTPVGEQILIRTVEGNREPLLCSSPERERGVERERENCTDFSRMNLLTPLRMVSGRQHCRGSAPLLLVASTKAPFAISMQAISTLLRCSSFSRASEGFWTPESGRFSSSRSGVEHIPTVHSRASMGMGMVNPRLSLAQFTSVQWGTYPCCSV